MASVSIFCLASSRGRVDRIIHDLKGAGFRSTEIGVLFFDGNLVNDHADEHDPRALTGAAAQSAGPIRGGLAWIAGIGRLEIPDVGSFIAAGPIIAAMRASSIGTPGDAIARGLIHLGVPAAEAAQLAQRIKADGHLLISAHPTNGDQILRARDIFTAANAQDICTSANASVPATGPGDRCEDSPALPLDRARDRITDHTA